MEMPITCQGYRQAVQDVRHVEIRVLVYSVFEGSTPGLCFWLVLH